MTDQNETINHYADFRKALTKLAPADPVPRPDPDPEAVAKLRSMVGQPVTFRDWEVTDHGVRQIEVEAMLIGVYE